MNSNRIRYAFFHRSIRKAQAARSASSVICLALLTCLLPFGMGAADLSNYRNFAFGSDLDSVSVQIGKAGAETTILHRRPALIQEVSWRPQLLGPVAANETVHEVTFTFFEETLYRIDVAYDRYETKGLTNADIIDAISAEFGPASTPQHHTAAQSIVFGDPGEVIAVWRDQQHRFELWRFEYGPTFKLVGLQSQREKAFLSAILEAERLDVKEAPMREAAAAAKADADEEAAAKASRATNKPKFRP